MMGGRVKMSLDLRTLAVDQPALDNFDLFFLPPKNG